MEAPINEIIVADLTQRTAVRVVGSNFRVKLAHPALSPDGRFLALVATPPSYFGIAEIWVVDLTTEDVVRIAEPERGYEYPVFSFDGARLLYFKEVLPHELRNNVTPIRPEYRAFVVPYGLAEFDFETRTETVVLSARAFSPCGLGYGGGDHSAFFCVSSLSGDIFDSERDLYRIDWSARPAIAQPMQISEASRGPVWFVQSLPGDRILLEIAPRDDQPRLLLVNYDAGNLAAAPFAELDGVPNPRTSADLSVWVGVHQLQADHGGVASTFVVGGGGRTTAELPVSAFNVTRTIELQIQFGR
jgi:hypothetical protein